LKVSFGSTVVSPLIEIGIVAEVAPTGIVNRDVRPVRGCPNRPA
jgi:hypothetical protein